MKSGPKDKQKKKHADSEKSSDLERDKTAKEASSGPQKQVTNVPEDRPGRTETSQERPDNPNPL